MVSKRYMKLILSTLMILSVFFLAGAGQLWAFSVDVKKLFYADNLDPWTLKRIVNYDFSDGTQSLDTIAIPGGFVTRPLSDTGLSYIFTPYPDPENDISLVLDTEAQKATLTSAAQGGCILSTGPTLPDPVSAVPQWEYALQLANFTGMTDASAAYSTQIGFGSETGGPQPEFTATWVPVASGRVLVLQAGIYNDSTELSEWALTSAPISGLDPARAFIELRIRIVPMTGYRDMIYEYRLSDSSDWITLGTATVPPSAPPLYLSFPAHFPYVALHREAAYALPRYNVQLLNNKITVIKGQTAEFVLGVQFNNYTSTQGVSFTTDAPALNALFIPAPVKRNGGAVMKIDTAGLDAGTYPAHIQYGEGTPDAGTIPFTLEVLTVSEIRFFQFLWNSATSQFDKMYIAGPVDATAQGQILEGFGVEVLDGTGNLITNPAVNLRSDHSLLVVSNNGFGNEIYAVDNVTGAQLHAETPDGFSRSLTVNVNVPDAPKVQSVLLGPDTVTNARTEPVQFTATGTDNLGYGNMGLLAITDDTRDWSTDHLTVSGSFRLDLSEPPQTGTYLFNAWTTDALRVAPLTIVNDSGYAEIAGRIKSLDSSLPAEILEYFSLDFYDLSGNLIFSREHHHEEFPYRIGAIIPGTYKVRFNPGDGSMIQPQWWPNADDPADAETLEFRAGELVDDIFFFARAVPTLSFTGTVKEAGNDYPAVAVPGAVVDVYADTYVSGTATDANGTFSLTGIPQGQNFEIGITKDGFTPVYSEIFNWMQNIQALLPYGLFPAGILGDWGVTSGNGAIFGRVSQLDNPAGYLSGATVTALNAADASTTYPVTYLNPADGSFGGTATYENGVFAVLDVPDGVTIQMTVSHDGWTFAQPSAWITVRGNGISETSFFGTATSPPAGDLLAGTWGALHLQYENGPRLWFSEASRITFNGDGTGSLSGMKNDEMNWDSGDTIKPFGFPFTYSLSPNEDGSLNLAMTVTTEAGTETFTRRIVLSDNGNMAIQDGTDDPAWVKLSTIIRIDTAKSYGQGDLSGEYFGIGYERNRGTAIVDPPNGNGAYMAISSIETFDDTAGTYNYVGRANSILSDGAMILWDDGGFEAGNDRPYSVASDGTVSMGAGAFQGYLAGNGGVGIGTGSFSAADPGQWVEYLLLKKNDRAAGGGYTTADLDGTWAVVGFGDHVEGDAGPSFSAEIGTMVCDSSGHCVYNLRRQSSGTTWHDVKTLDITVAPDGSFGAAPGSSFAVPAGAIGNDGNTIILNPSILDPEDTSMRRVAFGVKATGTSDLSGGITFTGKLVDSLNAAVAGATVEQVGNPARSTVTGADGTFVLGGLPPGAAFSLRMAKEGFTDSFTSDFNSTTDIDARVRPFGLFVEGQLSLWGVTPGTGVIRSRVIDETGASVGGAVVTARSLMDQEYRVCYDNGCSDLTATEEATGRYIVMNVVDGDRVTVTAAKDGVTFNTRTFSTHGSGISQGTITGNAAAANLQAAFASAIEAYNLKDLPTFMSCVSAAYLESGTDYAAFQAEIQEDMSDPSFQQMSYEVTAVLVNGDRAVMEIVWDGGETENLFFIKEGTDWKLYGNQEKYDIDAWSGHTPSSYWVSLTVDDPEGAITSVTVTGPGIDGSIDLEHDTGQNIWSSWQVNPPYGSFGPEFGTPPPTPPLTYTFTITDGQETAATTATVGNFVEEFATPVSPAGEQTLAELTSFSWTGVGVGYRYRIELNDSIGIRLWESGDSTAGSVLYNGRTLETGSYSYNLLAEDSEGNFSMVTVPFSISTAPGKGDVNGDGNVTLADAILALKVVSGIDSAEVFLSADVNGDGRIGMAEVVYVLQYGAGVRTGASAQ